MPTNSYDLIVIGTDFAGLIAGTLCAKRGMRVLLLSHGGPPTGYQLGPHRLPIEPLLLTDLSHLAIKRVLDELNIGHILKRKLYERPVSFQFVAPDLRLDVTSDVHALGVELDREIGASEPIQALCRRAAEVAHSFNEILASDTEFPPIGFWKRRGFGRSTGKVHDDAAAWFEDLADDDLAMSLAGATALLNTRIGPDSVTAEACARCFHLARMGGPRVRGDWDTLRDIFLEKLRQGNGETRAARVAEITFSWGKANGVRLDSGEELGASHIVAALPVSDLLPLVGRKVPKRLTQCVDGVSIGGYRYTLNLVVDEAGVPEGMSSPVFLVSDMNQPLIGDNAMVIHVDEPDDEARVVVTISAICPVVDDDAKLDSALADLRVQLRERLETVMPFFSEHVLLAHAPHEATPPEGVEAEPGKGFPIAPEPVWESSLDAALGVSAVPYQVGLKNVTVASSQVLPQLGIEGAFVTGRCAAKIVCDASGRKRDYLKDEVISGG